MKNLVDRLIKIETLAARIYNEAASHFKDDRELALFLKALSADEVLHARMIEKAAARIGPGIPVPSQIDQSSVQYTEDYLYFLQSRMSAKALTKEKMLYYIVAVEFAEYNNVFAEVFKALGRTEEVRELKESILAHRGRIEAILESQPNGELLEKIRAMESRATGKGSL